MAEDVPPERPSEVEPGLWVCSEAAVPAALADRSLGITHLISIGYPPPENPAGAARGGDDEDGGGVKTLRVEEDMPLEAESVSDSLNRVQKNVEEYFYGIRKEMFKYDEILSTQV